MVAAVGSTSEAGPAVAQGEEALDGAEDQIKELEDLEDYYFGADKDQKMKKLSGDIISLVDSVISVPGPQPSREVKVRGFFLKGRAHSLVVGQEKVAEQLLAKALKLDPLYLQAWNSLGEVHWNNGDYKQAKSCFEQAIELCGANKVSLRNLSMVLRAVEVDGEGDEQSARRGENYAKALDKAKEAVALDAQDPLNWETLGNAYVGDFFVNGKRPDEISRALIAYDKAEAAYEKIGKRNPSLQLNRGRAARYIEDYDLALRSYRKAHDIGAAGASSEGQRVLELVQRLTGLVQRKGDLRGRSLRELTADFPQSESPHRTLAQMRGNENEQAPLAAKLVSLIDRQDDVPVLMVCCDSAGDFFVLSVYNAEFAKIAEAAVPMKSVLLIQQPKFRQIAVGEVKGKQPTYPCVRVAHPGDVTVSGAASLGSCAVRSVFKTKEAERAAVPEQPAEKEASEAKASAKASAKSKAEAKKAKAEAKAGAKPEATVEPEAKAEPAEPKAQAEPKAKAGSKAKGKAKAKAAAPFNPPSRAKLEEVVLRCKENMAEASRQAGEKGLGRAGITKALNSNVRKLLETELGPGAGEKVQRVEDFLERRGRGEVHEENTKECGKRYAPGWIAGLEPNIPFHDVEQMPWVAELRSNWTEIRDELKAHLENEKVWQPGAYSDSNQAYAPEWRISGILVADEWKDAERWQATHRILKGLTDAPNFTEIFFARMRPNTMIAPHSDNLNYVLTSHLGLELEEGSCSIQVGSEERDWEEGGVICFDTTYIHSARNYSSRNRYVMVMRFWHPDLTLEERKAIHLSHLLLAATPDPERRAQQVKPPAWS